MFSIKKNTLELVRTRTRIARAFGSGTKVHSLALGESASQLRLVHGFEDEFEFEFEFSELVRQVF